MRDDQTSLPTLCDAATPDDLHSVRQVLTSIDPSIVFPEGKVNCLIEEYRRYRELLGLSSISSLGEIVGRHVYESVLAAVLAKKCLQGNSREICDLGTGNGFPGLVIAAMLPETSVTLVESSTKRAAYLATCIAAMQMQNVQVVNLHLTKPAKEISNRFDVITHRAFSKIERVTKLAEAIGRDDYSIIGFASELATGSETESALGSSGYIISDAIRFRTLSGGYSFVYAACKLKLD